jgi:nucleoside-diphosphate-sugar epimerase
MPAPVSDGAPDALVIGGLGYIGQEVCLKLLKGGFRVTCLDCRLHGQAASPALTGDRGFTLVEGDATDMRLLAHMAGHADLIVMLAALVGEAACDADPDTALILNLVAPLAVREAALIRGRARRLIFASTDSCYGKRPGVLLDEGSTLEPVSLYASLKARAETALLAGNRPVDPLQVTVLRLATVYGAAPRMRFDLAVNVLTREATLKKRMTVFSGEQWRPLVHVRDAALAFLLAATAPEATVAGKVFNIGSNDQNVQFKDLGKLISSTCPGSELVFEPGEPDLRDYRVDYTRARDELGFKAEVDLPSGIAEIRDALIRGDWPDPYSRGYRNA